MVLVVNKVDLVKKLRLLPLIDEYRGMHEFADIVPVSAKTGDGVEHLLELALARMPEGPAYFPDDVVTDQPMRVLAAEIIREKLLQKTRDELPFAIAVGIDSFKEEGRMARIGATIYVEKDSQKAIVIGKHGQILKDVGTYARIDMENLFGMKVFLELWVKVKGSWRQDERMLVELGY